MAGHVLTVAQQKGGSGKTTLAIHLAVRFAETGKSVAILDTDPQGSLGRWFMARRERTDGAPGLEFGTASAWGVSYECEKLSREHDLVIIDTPPKIDADLRPALREADLVLIPVATSQMDLWATESVQELARREGRPCLVVMNRVPPRARLTGTIIADIEAAGMERAGSVLGNRVAYAEALGRGQAAGELKRTGPAAQEVAALADEIAALLD
ncbi:ParA family partition ATPase [Pseudoruegeria sp. HB172150]|uniref:ParA family partition ATPase n=1 Tax=Pseudoruegeria sp. HB172150 TaxID=2721164 RepID=UPI00155303DE|nr:ParA family partition ATPase [Pseudoruegeria sp. HB172150]